MIAAPALSVAHVGFRVADGLCWPYPEVRCRVVAAHALAFALVVALVAVAHVVARVAVAFFWRSSCCERHRSGLRLACAR